MRKIQVQRTVDDKKDYTFTLIGDDGKTVATFTCFRRDFGTSMDLMRQNWLSTPPSLEKITTGMAKIGAQYETPSL